MQRLLLSLLVLGWFHLSATALRAHSAAEEMAEAASHFLAALSPEQREKATFEMKGEDRFDWHFIPRARKGLPFKEMTAAQRLLGHALLNSAMSQRGYLKATTIMSLEQVLHELENKAPHRDAELYFFSVFGKPEGHGVWGWRVEGHHLSLNFTLVNGRISVTPSFFGTNPAEVRTGPRAGLRVLKTEEDLARLLVRSFNEEQRKLAIISNVAPPDVITGADRKARVLTPVGISMVGMSETQVEMFWELLKEYVHRYRPEVAEQDIKKIQKSGPAEITFAWAGSTEPREGHYYRIQGPTFLVEYDNTQNDANHIHAVWRDLENDFGLDLLRQHYEDHPHPR